MAPNVTQPEVLLEAAAEAAAEAAGARKPAAPPPQEPYRRQIVWRNVIAFVYLHAAAAYGWYIMFTGAMGYTVLFTVAVGHLAGLGITAGAHRLWAHRAYRARWPLRAFLMLCQTVAFQNHIYEWVRDHRVHHKYTDTDADPHNAQRGFFFSHMGWLMVRKHPAVRARGRSLDMRDLRADPIVMWQKRYYIPLMVLCCFVIPSWIPVQCWGERLSVAYYVTLARYTMQLNFTWLVNSAAHIWGMRPYDKTFTPAENRAVAIVSLGEGWHNYHHVFPWDYKAGELGNYRTNITTAFIDACAALGLAYDLKSVPSDHVRRRAERTGDGSHPVWGWGDADAHAEDVAAVQMTHRRLPAA